MIEQHPHEAWQQSTFGCAHISQHSQGIDNDEFDHAYSGYTEGLRSAASANPLSTPEGVVAHEEGRQNVRDINGTPLCDWHADRAKELMGLSDQIGRQTGLIDETEPHTHTETPAYPGQCAACASAQGKNEGRPWDAPQGGGFRPSPMSEHQVPQRSWPNKPKRTGPMPLLPYSTSVRVAVRTGQKALDPAANGLHRVAYQISRDMPDVVVLRKIAHDSGDGQTILHCPFCGSGQVIATSDGGVECEFCHASFTVQVQPQYPAFPQTLDGAPVNVPGMGPDFSQYGGTPPGEEAPVPMDGEDEAEGDESGNNPFAEGEDETEPPEEGDDGGDDSGGGGNPFAKKSYVALSGATLTHDAYLRHLALASASNREATLARLRAVNGTR